MCEGVSSSTVRGPMSPGPGIWRDQVKTREIHAAFALQGLYSLLLSSRYTLPFKWLNKDIKMYHANLQILSGPAANCKHIWLQLHSVLSLNAAYAHV